MNVTDLPGLNALLNGTAALLLATGYYLVRTGRREAHRRAMTAAFACSVLFLVSYLVYHFEAGSVRFRGTGGVRTFYLTVLLTHTVLAAVVPFLAVTTLVLARKERFEAHRRLARVTLPIWLYVSVTGVVIYLMLYRMGI